MPVGEFGGGKECFGFVGFAIVVIHGGILGCVVIVADGMTSGKIHHPTLGSS